jgi:Xaa-Pro aminopeptidase
VTEALILYGDTERSPTMRHEVPIAIGDPFLVIIGGERTWISCSSLERERVAACRPDAELLDLHELGFHELLGSALSRLDLELELLSRAVARTGVEEASVEFELPVGLAERLRADGVTLTVDDELVKLRRRAKSPAELAGIRRAQQAAEAAMATAAQLLAGAVTTDGQLELDGRPLTAERLRKAMRDACWARGALLGPEAIVARSGRGSVTSPAAARCRPGCRSRSTCGPRTTPRAAGPT